jgi:SAM-dependent methyltransferase
MDYDKSTISTVYDQARGLAPGLLQRWLDLVARDASPARGSLIVDVGCGTGRFSEPLAERFSARVLGVDPFEQMLDVAREKTRSDRVEFRRSTAESPRPERTWCLCRWSFITYWTPAQRLESAGGYSALAVISACALSLATETFLTDTSFW